MQPGDKKNFMLTGPGRKRDSETVMETNSKRSTTADFFSGETMPQSPQQRDDKGPETPARTEGAAKRIPLRDKKITVTLSLPKAIFGIFFLLFILIWVFIFGIMIGRGHNPEDVVPELNKVMPTPSAPATPPVDDGMNDILKPQDLQYHDTLKKNEPAPPPAPPRPTPPPPAPAPVPAPQPTAPAQKPPAPKVTAPSTQTVYNYVYQVAAFNNTAAAQAMQKKLQQGGFSTKIEQGETRNTTWYRVLVLFKGKQEDTRELRAKLAPYGISTIILRGKTPAR